MIDGLPHLPVLIRPHLDRIGVMRSEQAIMTVIHQPPQFVIGSIRIEITHHHHSRRRPHSQHRIGILPHPPHDDAPCPACRARPAAAARQMAHDDVERVACGHETGAMEQITCRRRTGSTDIYCDRARRQQAEALALVDERYIYAPFIRRVGDDIAVAQLLERRIACEITHHIVILDLAQCHQSRDRPVPRVDYGA